MLRSMRILQSYPPPITVITHSYYSLMSIISTNVTKTRTPTTGTTTTDTSTTSGRKRRRRVEISYDSSWEYKVSFWCLNASVIFEEITKLTRSILMASGTIAPIESFASELGVPFRIRLEARHVLTFRQVLLGWLGERTWCSTLYCYKIPTRARTQVHRFKQQYIVTCDIS